MRKQQVAVRLSSWRQQSSWSYCYLSAHAVVGDKKVYDMTVDEKEWRANSRKKDATVCCEDYESAAERNTRYDENALLYKSASKAWPMSCCSQSRVIQ
jgi:hypothetical protein